MEGSVRVGQGEGDVGEVAAGRRDDRPIGLGMQAQGDRLGQPAGGVDPAGQQIGDRAAAGLMEALLRELDTNGYGPPARPDLRSSVRLVAGDTT
ncbi:hypothetical protein ACGFNP_07890 [Nonomuraea sp. NPDC049269]|uniref:hypothetical protein n=1 Tax=Nonomuraea sp. NPDC049269 TaxID=3364349 RepID=UPI003716824F